MQALKFNGRGGEFFGIWIVNLLLCIVTLGLYYPWAKVRTLRYFYGRTALADRTFDYHATGKQLFISYLIALGFVFVYILLTRLSPILGLIAIGALLCAVPWIIWRSLIFDARMTSFSNVRFGFAGELKPAYINYLVLPLAMYVTIVIGVALTLTVTLRMQSQLLGFITTLATIALVVYIAATIAKRNIEYIVGNLTFGQGAFAVNVAKKQLLFIYLKAFALFAVLITIVGFIASSFGLHLDDLNINDATQAMPDSSIIITMIISYLMLIITVLLVMAYTHCAVRRYVYANTILDGKIHFKSTAKALPLIGILVTNVLLILFTFGLGTPWAVVRVTRYLTENTHTDADDSLNDYITQASEYQSGLGEQLGEAFGVGISI